jgi:thiol-disulfide isomerase/thioredoxin
MLALGACSAGGGGNGDSPVGGQNFVAGDGTVTLLPPDRRPVPQPLRGPTVDGSTVDLATYRGHVVVLNVWGSWCAPCQKEAPELEAAYRQLQPKGVKFLGIDIRESGPQAAQAFQRTYGVTYPSLYDATGDSLLALRGVASPNAIPSTLVVDGRGRIAARILGATTKTTLVELVDDLLTGGQRSTAGSMDHGRTSTPTATA